ncbi:putative quinone-oxidoreductase homolog, chloroplastic isoform X2 [Amborella trichopoda]|uniref:putative quinone-oxidoreductase homolog, chloroplastic isoform X2 n=1 Tax=Amborella trichopoda TaxID=13333 RepID=UPI0009C19943|nr:putative quinone-oxidoreductase homolog, chloroplastic isoform X2 [Amborella trichopoda]|eukprot:XP_020525567.1 putative quinone-oxidoreductase homolog, chloroplastic isoform X2 [Amborella trichopoda]
MCQNIYSYATGIKVANFLNCNACDCQKDHQIPSYCTSPYLSLQHVEILIPSPKNDEVLLKLEAASLNPADCKIQEGMLRPFLPGKFPFVPDVAGEVVEVGSRIQNFKVGDKVVSMLHFMNGGGLAEYAVVSKTLMVERPPEVSASEGAALPMAGLTALQALTKAAGLKLEKSSTDKEINVLVTAASGGVGHFAVQLAKLGNIHVTATCGARNIELVKSLGADEVIDYKTPEGAALKSPSGRKYDVVIHCATNIPWSIFEPNLSENGKVIDMTPRLRAFLTSFTKKLTFSKKKLVPLFLAPKGENLDYMLGLVRDGKIKAVIDSKFPLAKAEEAWAKIMDGHATGKIIVTSE